MHKQIVESTCRHCKNPIDGNARLFCSEKCRDEYILEIEKKVIQATDEDPSHTTKLSED